MSRLAHPSVLIPPHYSLHHQMGLAVPSGRELDAPPSRSMTVWLAPAGSEVVGIPGLHARPLHDGASCSAVAVLAFRPLWPTGRRILPAFLPPIDGQVEQPGAVVHRLGPAPP